MKITKEMGITPSATIFTTREPVFLDVTKEPFALYGFAKKFRRLPDEIAEAVNSEAERMSRYSAGCRIRFKTTSDYIGIYAVMGGQEHPSSMAPASRYGYDIYFYENGCQRYAGTMGASRVKHDGYFEERMHFGNNDQKDVVIYLPICAEMKELYVMLREGCELDAPSKYKIETPIVWYGSSIVQGIGAGRPGTIYTNELSRRFDANILNLGFGGGAKAEQVMMDYLSDLEMCVFVYDYDHNTPSSEYLKSTHYNGYKTIRDKHPGLPIILASRPDYHFNPDNREANERKRQIILATFERAKAAGDENIWFVDGSEMYPESARECASSDGCHPNDLGYFLMANAFAPALKEALAKSEKAGK